MTAAVAAYLLYRWAVDDRVFPAAFLAAGALLVSWAVIEELTVPPQGRYELLVVGSIVLGLGLAGLGLYLTLR
jgi:hypothetical protein